MQSVTRVDTVMRRAYKRIVPERLLQTRVPSDLAKKIEASAKQEGDTVAGWIRRLLFRQFGVVFVEAWTRPEGSATDDGITSRCQPQFYLRPLRDISASDRVFAVHDHARLPMPASVMSERGSSLAGKGRWIMLRASPIPWEVVTQFAVGSILEVTLRPVRESLAWTRVEVVDRLPSEQSTMRDVSEAKIEPTLVEQIRQTRIFQAMARRLQSISVTGVAFGEIFRGQTADGIVDIAEIAVWLGFRSGSRHPTPTYPEVPFTRGVRRADFAKIAEGALAAICRAKVDRIVRSLPAELDAGVIERLVRAAGGKVDALRGFLTDKEANGIERVVSAGHLDKNAAYLASFHKGATGRLLYEAVQAEVPRITGELEHQAGKSLLEFVAKYGHAVSDDQLLEARNAASTVEPQSNRPARTRTPQ